MKIRISRFRIHRWLRRAEIVIVVLSLAMLADLGWHKFARLLFSPLDARASFSPVSRATTEIHAICQCSSPRR